MKLTFSIVDEAERLLLGALLLVIERLRSRSSRRNFEWKYAPKSLRGKEVHSESKKDKLLFDLSEEPYVALVGLYLLNAHLC